MRQSPRTNTFLFLIPMNIRMTDVYRVFFSLFLYICKSVIKVTAIEKNETTKRTIFLYSITIKKTALTASIVISFILAFVMLSSSMYYAISLDKTAEWGG